MQDLDVLFVPLKLRVSFDVFSRLEAITEDYRMSRMKKVRKIENKTLQLNNTRLFHVFIYSPRW